MTSDKPNVHVLKVPELDIEGTYKPIAVPLPSGRGFVTFPNIYKMDAEDAETLMRDMQEASMAAEVTTALKKWLPTKELEKFNKAWPTWAEQMHVVGLVQQAMTEMLGDLGEGHGSDDS